MIIERARPLHERAGVKDTRLRGWDLRMDEFPHRSEAEWAALIKRTWEPRPLPERQMALLERAGVVQVYEDHNEVTDPGMETFAALIAKAQASWQDGGWYVQALGTGAAAALNTQRDLTLEIARKALTEHVHVPGTRVNNCLTLFNAASFASARTTILAAPTPTATTFTLNAATGFMIGDFVRIGLTTGYEYRTILNLVGAVVTLDSALSAAPVGTESFDQVVEEAGLFGDLPAGYTTGTIAVTNGNAVVTGTGTAWATAGTLGGPVLAAGDKIRLATSRTWYTILSVDSDTQLTLTAPFAGATSSGHAYWLRGSMFNRGTGLRYVKLSTRGYVFENQWTTGGA